MICNMIFFCCCVYCVIKLAFHFSNTSFLRSSSIDLLYFSLNTALFDARRLCLLKTMNNSEVSIILIHNFFSIISFNFVWFSVGSFENNSEKVFLWLSIFMFHWHCPPKVTKVIDCYQDISITFKIFWTIVVWVK